MYFKELLEGQDKRKNDFNRILKEIRKSVYGVAREEKQKNQVTVTH